MAPRWTWLGCALGVALTHSAAALAQGRPAVAIASRGTVDESSAPAPPWPGQETATVTLLSEPQGLLFYRVNGVILEDRRGPYVRRVYEPMCTAPCTIELQASVQHLALGRPGELPRPATAVTIPTDGTELHGYFESRRDLRIAGWILFSVAAVTGAALLATAENTHEHQAEHAINLGQTVAGMAVLLVGMPVGLVLGLARDVPRIDAHASPQPSSKLDKAPGVVVTGGF